MAGNEPTGSPTMLDIEKHFDLLLQQVQYFKEYEEPALCVYLTRKASFHLRSSGITYKLPPRRCWPTQEDLRKAEMCLNSVPFKSLPNRVNYYVAEYYCCRSDLYLWRQQYKKAIKYAQKAKDKYSKGNITNSNSLVPEQRIRLLKRLQKEQCQEDKALEAILVDYR